MKRIVSIDVFRALTMFLMIWVNDFWTLNMVPKWLKHAIAGEDYLGFSDLIFPWFLFVMGLSIPFSIENRLKMVESRLKIWKHIIFRTIALLIMGLFHMNMEMYNHDESIISKALFTILSTSAFFMIWNTYSNSSFIKNSLPKIVQIIGMLILLVMILIYKGKGYNNNVIGFSIHWWGILGLIGWSYAITASIYFIFKRSIIALVIAFILSLGLNVLSASGISYNMFSWQSKDWIPGSGGLQSLTFGGIITSLIIMKNNYKNNLKKIYIIILGSAVISLVLGFISHKFFIISKISGTPTWILYSLSTALFVYIFIFWLIDEKGKSNWFSFINIAGSATLTCYLIPYFYYSFQKLLDIHLPIFFTTGIIGLIKSIIYSIIIITIAGVLSKMKIRLKI